MWGVLLMNSIGMTRRIDALGRIVVPAELRRILEIRVGDLLDIRVEDGRRAGQGRAGLRLLRVGRLVAPVPREARVRQRCVERLSGSYGAPNGVDEGIATASS